MTIVEIGQDVTLADGRLGQVWDWHPDPSAVWVITTEGTCVSHRISTLQPRTVTP